MKKFFIPLIAGLVFSTAAISKDREISHSVKLSDPKKPAQIEASLASGSIRVEGYKGSTVEIVAKIKEMKQVSDSNERTEEKTSRSSKGLKKISNKTIFLEIEEDDNEISIGSMNRNQNIELVLKVPFNSNLELGLHRGEDIVIKDVHGSIEVSNHSGPITATGIRGPIVAESMRHDMVVSFDKFSTGKPSSLNAHRGNIDVTLPEKSQLTIEVKTYQGEIYSGLNAEFASIDTVEKGDSEHEKRTSFGGAMAATLNKGNQKLLINTFRGDIYLRNK